MIDTLRNLPTIELLLVSLATTIVLLLGTGLVARQMRPGSPNTQAALEAYKIIVTFTAILLSFTLVQAETAKKSAEALVSREAGAMNQLDRLLIRYQTPGAADIRPLLKAYMASVVEQDWPAMRAGKATTTANKLLAPLNRAVTTLDGGISAKPQLYAEMLKQLDTINDARLERIDSSDSGVSDVIWQANGALCLVLLTLSALINLPGRLVAIGGHAVAIAILLSITFAVDQPYRGEVSVGPDPIVRALASVEARRS